MLSILADSCVTIYWCVVCTLLFFFFLFLMIRRPPRSTQSRSSAASDVYKRQIMDISQEENTEDFHKISAINPVESGYLYASIWRLCVKRFPWLFLLMFASSLTSGLISLYNNVIQLSLIHISEPTRPY